MHIYSTHWAEHRARRPAGRSRAYTYIYNIYICMCIYININIRIFIHIYNIYIYTYIYTFTHWAARWVRRPVDRSRAVCAWNGRRPLAPVKGGGLD